MGVNFYLPIAKVDREQRMVFGYASTPTRDLDGEVIELEAIKDALPDYMQWRNIREMHKPSAVGVAKEANVDEKGLYIGAKIVDDDAWKKVSEEVYKGFSIGGDVTRRDGSTITGLKLIEISLVDRPANPDCRIDVIKAAGVSSQEFIRPSNAMSAVTVAIGAGGPGGAGGGKDFRMAENADTPRDGGEVGWLRRMVERLAGGGTAKGGDAPGDGDKPYGNVEYADPGYRGGKKRYPIDTEEHIRAAWSYIHHGKNADEYTSEQLASIKRRIVAAWKKKIGEDGPPEAKAAEPDAEKRDAQPQDGHGSKPVDADDEMMHPGREAPAGADGFSRPSASEKKAATVLLAGAVAKLEGARMLAEECGVVLDRAEINMLSHIANAANELVDATETAKAAGISTGAGTMAEADIAKRAASGRHGDHLNKALFHIGEAHKCAMAAMPREEKAAGADGIQKAADHMERLRDHLVLAHHHVAAAAGGAGERGEGPADSDGRDYRAPRGEIEDLSQRTMTEGEPPPSWDATKPYPGKSAAARAETISKGEHEALLKAARLEGELEALRKQPASPKARVFAVPRGSLPVGEADEPSAMEKLFKGVDIEATDPDSRQAAARKMIGNMITNSATFARPVIGDPTFRGGAAR